MPCRISSRMTLSISAQEACNYCAPPTSGGRQRNWLPMIYITQITRRRPRTYRKDIGGTAVFLLSIASFVKTSFSLPWLIHRLELDVHRGYRTMSSVSVMRPSHFWHHAESNGECWQQ